MPVLHPRGGDKAAWARLNRDQDIKRLALTPEEAAFEDALLDL